MEAQTQITLPEAEPASFGAYLRSVRLAQEISIRALAKAIGKTPTYLSDIENGNNRPPDKPLLDQITAALRLQTQPAVAETLYDLAAKERGDIPADVKTLLYEKPSIIPLLRSIKKSPNGEALLQQAASIIRSACL